MFDLDIRGLDFHQSTYLRGHEDRYSWFKTLFNNIQKYIRYISQFSQNYKHPFVW